MYALFKMKTLVTLSEEAHIFFAVVFWLLSPERTGAPPAFTGAFRQTWQMLYSLYRSSLITETIVSRDPRSRIRIRYFLFFNLSNF